VQFLAYSIADVCAATSCGRTTVYAAIKCGELRAIKIGRRTVVTSTDLRAWLDARAELRSRSKPLEVSVRASSGN